MLDFLTLSSERLEVQFASMEDNPSTRFEHIPYVRQVVLDGKHTFLGKERTKDGPGTRGAGLMHGWLSDDTGTDGKYPVLGVGVAELQGEQYSVRKDYPCKFADIAVKEKTDTQISFCLTQGNVKGQSWRIERSYLVEGTCLTVSACIWNTGETLLAGREYCHNFFFFDEVSNGDSYTIKMRGVPDLHVVRGSIIHGDAWYKPYQFDKTLGTLAVSYDHDEDALHRVVVSNELTGTEVTVLNRFSPCAWYHWHSPWCVSPEAYCGFRLEKGQSCEIRREYQFTP